jgi:integrase
LSPKTYHEYSLQIKTLSKFFGEVRLTEITADMIRHYQRMRMTKCGPIGINHECGLLQQILKRIGHWETIGSQYQPLPRSKKKRGRALTNDERKKLFQLMRTNHNWDAARLCAMICINSTASPGEAYKLCLRDVDMEHRKVWIGKQGAKNDTRIRRNPINDELFEAFREALLRAKLLGSYKPEHYLFPFRAFGQDYDPTRHQTTFSTAWEKIIATAVRNGMNVEGLRLEDMRHTAQTNLLENSSVSEETAIDMAGHIDREMNRHYFHGREEARQNAAEALALKKPPQAELSTPSTDVKEIVSSLMLLLSKLLKTG